MIANAGQGGTLSTRGHSIRGEHTAGEEVLPLGTAVTSALAISPHTTDILGVSLLTLVLYMAFLLYRCGRQLCDK